MEVRRQTGLDLRVLQLLKIEERNKKKELEPPTSVSPPTAGSPPTPVSPPTPFKVPKPGSDNNNNNKVTIREVRLKAIARNLNLSSAQQKQRLPVLATLSVDEIRKLRDELPPTWHWSPLDVFKLWAEDQKTF